VAKYKSKSTIDEVYMLSWFHDPATFFEYFNSEERTKAGEKYKMLQPFLDYSYSRLLNPHRCISGSRNVQKTTTLQNETIEDGLCKPDERTVYVVPAEKHMVEIADDMEKKFDKYPLLKFFYEGFNKKDRIIRFKTGHLLEFRIMGHDYTGEKSAIAQHPHKIVVDEAQLISKEYLQQLTAGGQKGFEYLIAGVSNNLRDTALWYGVVDKRFLYIRYGMHEGPNWSEDMKQLMMEQTGGENTPGWKTLVQGLWGEQAYNVFGLGKLFESKETFIKHKHQFTKQKFQDMDSKEIINKLNLPNKDSKFVSYTMGIDVGGNSYNSPSQITIWGNEKKGEKNCGVLIYMLQLYNIGTVIQAEVDDYIFSVYDCNGMGIDAQAVGSDLYRNITEGKIITDPIKLEKYKRVCKPFTMGSAITIDKVIDLETQKEKELKQPVKIKATTLLQDDLREGLIELPPDQEVHEAFQAETWQGNRQRIGGITYLNTKNEHLIDAARMYRMCLWQLEQESNIKTSEGRDIPAPIIRKVRYG